MYYDENLIESKYFEYYNNFEVNEKVIKYSEALSK